MYIFQAYSIAYAPGVAVHPHWKGSAPDLATMINGHFGSMSATADDLNITVTNTDVGPHPGAVVAFWFDHSIETAFDPTVGPLLYGTAIEQLPLALTGGGVIDDIPHACGYAPDIVLVDGSRIDQTVSAYHCGLGDDTVIYMADPGPGFSVDGWVIKCHSIVAPLRSTAFMGWGVGSLVRGPFPVVVPWDGGPAGNRTVVHSLPWLPDAVLVIPMTLGPPQVSDPSLSMAGGVTADTVDIYTSAGVDSYCCLWGIKYHSRLDTSP